MITCKQVNFVAPQIFSLTERNVPSSIKLKDNTMHFDLLLKTAHENGAEIMVQLKNYCGDPYKGKVLELFEETFTLFHSGVSGGVLWSFSKADVAFCGLIVALPAIAAVEASVSKSSRSVIDVIDHDRAEGGE